MSMAAATAAVMMTNHTHPAALLVMSAGVLACGLAAYFFHTALFALAGKKQAEVAVTGQRREAILGDKNRVLHTIKEIEFDHRMGKVNAKDFETLVNPLRQKAAALIAELDRLDAAPAPAGRGATPTASAVAGCAGCGTANDPDAKFCKSCGAKL